MSRPTETFITQDDRTRPATVPMYEAGRKHGAAAAGVAAYALSDAAAVFKLISEGLSTGHFARNDSGVISLTNICAAHFSALAENEGYQLEQLRMALENAARPGAEEELPK